MALCLYCDKCYVESQLYCPHCSMDLMYKLLLMPPSKTFYAIVAWRVVKGLSGHILRLPLYILRLLWDMIPP